MTNEEAILMLMHLQEPEPWEPEISEKAYDALEIAIEAVKRITPKRPILVNKNKEFDGNYYLTCPVCGSVLFERVTDEQGSRPYAWSHTYMCSDCGQALDTVDESFSKTVLEIVKEESSK